MNPRFFRSPKSQSHACSSDLLPLKPGSIESQLSSQSLLGRLVEDVDESWRTESLDLMATSFCGYFKSVLEPFWVNIYLSQNWHWFYLIKPTTKE